MGGIPEEEEEEGIAQLPPRQEESRILGIRRRVFFMWLGLLLLFVALGVGIGTGVGVGMKNRNNGGVSEADV